MMHNRFLSKCGVSLACLVSVWGMGAYAKTTELFRFPVDIPAGANGCSAKIPAASNGCTDITERALDSNGNCQDTSNVRTVCPGEQGNSCSIKSVSTVDNAQKVTFNCGDPDDDTEITIPNGAPGAGCAVKSVVQGTNKQTVTLRCGNTDSEVEIPNGTPGCTPIYTKTYINKVGDNSPTYNNTTRTDNTIGERAAITGCGEPVYLDTYDGPAGQDSVCSFSSSRNATNGIITFKSTCNGQAEQTIGTLSESDIANNAINKITTAGTFTTPSDVESAIDVAITTAALQTKLDTEYANLATTNAALADKVDQDDFETYQSQVTNALSNKADADSVYDKAHIDTALAAIESGTTPEHLQDLINQAVAGQYASTSDFNTLSDTVDGKLNKSDFVSELSKTQALNVINNAITSNSTVAGKADASALNTLEATVNGKLNKSDFVSELSKTQALNVINNAITSNSTVAGKASQSDLNTLAGRVTANETAIASKANSSDVYTKGEIDNQMATLATKEELASATMCNGQIETHSNGNKIEVVCVEN